MKIDWDNLVANGVQALPEKFRNKIANVALLLEDEPSKRVRREEGLAEDETLLGLYHGIPLSLRGDGYGVGETLPDTITLYMRPILEEAGNNPEDVQRVVYETIWHEFGHYFGLDEDEVEKREGERLKRENIS
jgi:predicted Zn-dependent protease with MMP-like domain